MRTAQISTINFTAQKNAKNNNSNKIIFQLNNNEFKTFTGMSLLLGGMRGFSYYENLKSNPVKNIKHPKIYSFVKGMNIAFCSAAIMFYGKMLNDKISDFLNNRKTKNN